MKIELKNISFYERMSQETNCFVADLYIDGVKCASVKNDGCGGCTDYTPYNADKRDLIKQVEEYCLTLPPLTFETFELKMNLEHFIDELFENWLKAKYKKQEDKKLQKNFEKGICYGTLESYNIVYWSLPIRAMLVHPTGKNTLIKKIADLKAQGENILNTNLPKELL